MSELALKETARSRVVIKCWARNCKGQLDIIYPKAQEDHIIDESVYLAVLHTIGGPGSSVGIATGYGLDSPGIESSGFGGLGVCVLASGTQDRGFAPDLSRRIFHNGKSTARSLSVFV
jgi:hypothetical protein